MRRRSTYIKKQSELSFIVGEVLAVLSVLVTIPILILFFLLVMP
jgi:hypothetical protein